MGRAPCCDKANVKRGPWSPEEDDILKSFMDKHGTGGNWIALPHKAGLKRCGKSCRLRWLNYLRPDIKHGGFTEEEDNIICRMYASIGSRWSIIAAQLPGRTDNDIKNYWNTRLKKKILVSNNNKSSTSSGSSSSCLNEDRHRRRIVARQQRQILDNNNNTATKSSVMENPSCSGESPSLSTNTTQSYEESFYAQASFTNMLRRVPIKEEDASNCTPPPPSLPMTTPASHQQQECIVGGGSMPTQANVFQSFINGSENATSAMGFWDGQYQSLLMEALHEEQLLARQPPPYAAFNDLIYNNRESPAASTYCQPPPTIYSSQLVDFSSADACPAYSYVLPAENQGGSDTKQGIILQSGLRPSFDNNKNIFCV